MYVADLEVPFVIDAAQDLSRGAPAYMLQKRDKRGEPKLYPAPTVLCPPRIFGIRAESLRGGVCAIFRSTTTAVDPAAIGRSESLSSPCTHVDSVRDSFPRKEVTLMKFSKATKAGRGKEAKARKHLTVDQFFFHQNARYSYDSMTDTPEQGRLRCSKELADAETIGQRLGYVFEWEFDEGPDSSWMSDEEREHDHEGLCCRIPAPETTRHSLASLWGITDPDSRYRRVIEAELAAEAIADLDREIETLDAH
jgi:hypothetical protein